MSQYTAREAGSPVIPDIEFLSGQVGTNPVGPDGAFNINIFAEDIEDNVAAGIQTRGDAAGNTIYVQLTNRLRGTASVTGAVTVDLITFDLGDTPAVFRFRYEVTGRDTTSGDGVGYSGFCSVRTDGASATVIQTPFFDSDEDASLSGALIDVVASGNNMILRVTGVAGQTISYNALGEYIQV